MSILGVLDRHPPHSDGFDLVGLLVDAGIPVAAILISVGLALKLAQGERKAARTDQILLDYSELARSLTRLGNAGQRGDEDASDLAWQQVQESANVLWLRLSPRERRAVDLVTWRLTEAKAKGDILEFGIVASWAADAIEAAAQGRLGGLQRVEPRFEKYVELVHPEMDAGGYKAYVKERLAMLRESRHGSAGHSSTAGC